MYLVEGKSLAVIGREIGIEATAVQHRLETLHIPRRNTYEWTKGERNPMYGKTHTPQALKKIRDANERQFSDPDARYRHGAITARQIAEGHTGKSNNKLEQRFTRLLQEAPIHVFIQTEQN